MACSSPFINSARLAGPRVEGRNVADETPIDHVFLPVRAVENVPDGSKNSNARGPEVLPRPGLCPMLGLYKAAAELETNAY